MRSSSRPRWAAAVSPAAGSPSLAPLLPQESRFAWRSGPVDALGPFATPPTARATAETPHEEGPAAAAPAVTRVDSNQSRVLLQRPAPTALQRKLGRQSESQARLTAMRMSSAGHQHAGLHSPSVLTRPADQARGAQFSKTSIRPTRHAVPAGGR